jgi:hypothetical protein
MPVPVPPSSCSAPPENKTVLAELHGNNDLRPSQEQAGVDAEQELGGTGKATFEMTCNFFYGNPMHEHADGLAKGHLSTSRNAARTFP